MKVNTGADPKNSERGRRGIQHSERIWDAK